MTPSIMRNIPATTEDALNGLRFKVQGRPALVSLYAAGATEADTISFAVDSQEFLVAAEHNVEAASGVVDVDRDQILFREPVPAGEYFMRAVVTADTKFLLVIEQL
jgi:hypothetical protein